MSYDLWGLEDGNLLQTHGPDQCEGNFCALHNPSDHPLKHAVMRWDSSRNLMVRFCAHGLWHPDPDDIAFKHRANSVYWASICEQHHCDGCCRPGAPDWIAALMPLTALPPLEYSPTLWDKTKWAALAFVGWIKSFFRK